MIPTPTLRQKLQDAAAAQGNGTSYSISGYASAAFTVTGTFTGTITFEASNDGGTNWFALNATPINSTTAATTATTTGIYIAKITCLEFIRARISTYGSGNITVDLRASQILIT